MKKILLFCCAALILCACKKDPQNEPTDYGQRINNPVDTTTTKPSEKQYTKAYIEAFKFTAVQYDGYYYKVSLHGYDYWGSEAISFTSDQTTQIGSNNLPRFITPNKAIVLGDKTALDYYDYFTVRVFAKKSGSSTQTLCLDDTFRLDINLKPIDAYNLISSNGKTKVSVRMMYE